MWLYDNISVPRIRHVPWAQVVAASLVAEWITAVVAIFGTTISPYLFFWRRLPPRPRPRRRCVPWPGSAFALFSAGIIGTGLLAVPDVLEHGPLKKKGMAIARHPYRVAHQADPVRRVVLPSMFSLPCYQKNL